MSSLVVPGLFRRYCRTFFLCSLFCNPAINHFWIKYAFGSATAFNLPNSQNRTVSRSSAKNSPEDSLFFCEIATNYFCSAITSRLPGCKYFFKRVSIAVTGIVSTSVGATGDCIFIKFSTTQRNKKKIGHLQVSRGSCVSFQVYYFFGSAAGFECVYLCQSNLRLLESQ